MCWLVLSSIPKGKKQRSPTFIAQNPVLHLANNLFMHKWVSDHLTPESLESEPRDVTPKVSTLKCHQKLQEHLNIGIDGLPKWIVRRPGITIGFLPLKPMWTGAEERARVVQTDLSLVYNICIQLLKLWLLTFQFSQQNCYPKTDHIHECKHLKMECITVSSYYASPF